MGDVYSGRQPQYVSQSPRETGSECSDGLSSGECRSLVGGVMGL